MNRRTFLLTSAAAAVVAATPGSPEAPEVGRVAFYLDTKTVAETSYERRVRLMAQYGRKIPLGEVALREVSPSSYLSDTVIPPMPIPAGSLIETRTVFHNRQGMQEMFGSRRRLKENMSSLRVAWFDAIRSALPLA